MEEEHKNLINKTSKVEGLCAISSQLAIEEQALSHNLNSQAQQENHQMTTIQPFIQPTPMKENEVGQQHMKEKDVDESVLAFNTLTDLPFENLTLVEEEENPCVVTV